MEQPSSIATLVRSVRRRIVVILLCCILVPAAAFAVSMAQQKQYTASAALLFRDAGFDQKLFGAEVGQPVVDPARAAATNLTLVSLDVVAERTERRLPEAGSVKSHIDVRAKGQSDVVGIAATYPDPRLAARVANAFAEQYIAFRRNADRAKIAQARALVRRRLQQLPPDARGGEARALRTRLDQLEILSSLQTGNAELVERAGIPSGPSSPKVARNTFLGVILGLLLGVGLALLLERLDRRIRDPKEIEDMFERPILGAIPSSRALARSSIVDATLPAAESEAFRMLRTNLRYFNIDGDVESVLVTSAAPGDGKSTVAWNFASTAAASGQKVLLIEADLRHPALANSLKMRGEPGLSTVLSGAASVEEVLQRLPVRGKRGDDDRTIDVVLAGPVPPNPADLLESDRMRVVITEAGEDYDLLVIDTPPTAVVSDAIPLLSQVGGVIVVARLAKTTRTAAIHLRNQLRHLHARVLGVVVNALGSDNEAYGYAYGYGMSDDGEVVPRSGPKVVEPLVPLSADATSHSSPEKAADQG